MEGSELSSAPTHPHRSGGAYVFGCGMAMGAADVVPGISGGSIAFILGIYAQLLEAISGFDPTLIGLLARGR